MISNDPCPYCQSLDINIEDVIWYRLIMKVKGLQRLDIIVRLAKIHIQ